MPLSVFQVLFKTNLIFKDFSRQPCIFKYFSSLCEPCTRRILGLYGLIIKLMISIQYSSIKVLDEKYSFLTVFNNAFKRYRTAALLFFVVFPFQLMPKGPFLETCKSSLMFTSMVYVGQSLDTFPIFLRFVFCFYIQPRHKVERENSINAVVVLIDVPFSKQK